MLATIIITIGVMGILRLLWACIWIADETDTIEQNIWEKRERK